MEITCPNCQLTFEAVTRRAVCEHCGTQLDVWALLNSAPKPAIPKIEPAAPAITKLEAPDFFSAPEPVRAAVARTSDSYATSFAPPEAVLDLPAADVVLDHSREPDPVLDDCFSDLPDEFRTQFEPVKDDSFTPAIAARTGGAGASVIDSSVASPHSEEAEEDQATLFAAAGPRSRLWLLLYAALVTLVVGIAYYFLAGGGSSSTPAQVASASEATPNSAAAVLPSVSPTATAIPATATPAVDPTPSPSSSPSPSPSPSPAPSPSPSPSPSPLPVTEAQKPAESQPAATLEQAGSESATRARAVSPETLRTVKFTLQVAALPDEEEAKRMIERLINAGLDARIVRGGGWYRVRVGAFPTKEEAAATGEKLKGAGTIASFFITDLR